MVKRKKRLKKGIESIKEQIELHKQKRKEAEEQGQEELVSYYDKEIEGMETQQEKKEEQLEKS